MQAAVEVPRLVAVVATLSKCYDLDYIWTQVDRSPAKDAASYYLQASEGGGEPRRHPAGPGRASGREDAEMHKALLAAGPHATAGCERSL